MILEAWRIADPEYGTTDKALLSGEGAARDGGRWNSKGVKVVYLGANLAQAMMEVLPHPEQLKGHNKIWVAFDESLVRHVALGDLPLHWDAVRHPAETQDVGDQWVRNEDSVVLRVPSAVVVGSSNYLLNPEHADRDKIAVGTIEEITLSPRLKELFDDHAG